MSVRSDRNSTVAPDAAIGAAVSAAADLTLAEGGSYCVASPENPLTRNVNVSIRASLDSLCLQKSRGTWAPSSGALKQIFQQKKFTSLDGEADHQGDLKSVVLHSMCCDNVVSTFPIAVGARITGVDDCTFSSTGEAYSMVALPNTNNCKERKLQADDVSLAYEFAKKFPGYTSENLSEKGIHEVSQRRFVLVAADHPIVSAISENADKLQMGEISMMPEGLVKISQGLYDSILPLVKKQVDSQIKVRDFSRAQVSIAPADFATWNDARAELLSEAKRPLKAQLEMELSTAADETAAREIRAGYQAKESQIEHEIDHKPMEFHLSLGVSYNFLSSGK